MRLGDHISTDPLLPMTTIPEPSAPFVRLFTVGQSHKPPASCRHALLHHGVAAQARTLSAMHELLVILRSNLPARRRQEELE